MDTELKTDLSVSLTAANVLSLLIALPLIVVLAGLYMLRWGGQLQIALSPGASRDLLLFLMVFVAGIVVHELILLTCHFDPFPFDVIIERQIRS